VTGSLRVRLANVNLTLVVSLLIGCIPGGLHGSRLSPRPGTLASPHSYRILLAIGPEQYGPDLGEHE